MNHLKYDANFNPYPENEGDEFFQNGYFIFNITRMIEFVAENEKALPMEKIPINELREKDSELDEKQIEIADLENPIILAEISPGYWNVIDGNHRVEKARRLGLKEIMGYRMSPVHHAQFLTTIKAYKAYIEYWNEKVDAALETITK